MRKPKIPSLIDSSSPLTINHKKRETNIDYLASLIHIDYSL